MQLSLCWGGEVGAKKCLLAEFGPNRKTKLLRLVKMLPALAMKLILEFGKTGKWPQNAIVELPIKALQIPSLTLLPRSQLLAQHSLLQSENTSLKSDLEAARDSHESPLSPSPV